MQERGNFDRGSSNEYLAPDYEHPKDSDEDDYIEEVDEGEIELEKLIEEQDAYIESLLEKEEEEERRKEQEKNSLYNNQPMSDLPFNAGGAWNTGGSKQEKAPWERDKPTAGGGTWGSRYSSGGFSFGATDTSKQNNQTGFSDLRAMDRKRIIICDFLDCLYESWSVWEESGRGSHTRPGVQIRGVFDLKPKFEVWDKIASFDPERLFIIFPATKYINALGGDEELKKIVINYVTCSVSSYLRMDLNRCMVLDEKESFRSKEKALLVAVNSCKRPQETLYVGVYSGRYGLSSKDLDAAKNVGISYLDISNLIDGRYEFE